ncbi:helix-turn-helix transcriptional regulator [Actinomadura darangshiensis]|uniref:Helix-turn-helix transcriptional regulator n=1 Tax=Actinomadura darangshiensis TaxID=705336 RepID=A0A4R5BGS8_9ACTN|nr:helix-turn-helix transcriptional regulator [Actinomadura darangshiensis]TDD84649.1 helix-turn-helix transcriptional regulator [Actinomadura darangshiensis]
MFVARTAEMGRLSEAHARARGAGPVTVLIGGEAGIGKSRLVAEFAARLPSGTRVVRGDCLEVGAGGLAYAPFIAAMRALVRELGAEHAAGLLPGRGRHGLAHWLPVLGPPDGVSDPIYGRARLFGDVLTLLEAPTGPLVLVLEDLQWADPSSRELLVFLVHNLSRPGVLVLGTYRSTDLDERHPLRPVLAGLARSPRVETLDPVPLSRADVGALVAGRLGRDPEPDEVAEIHRHSEGNPLFAEALADAGTRGGTPVRLRDLLLTGFRALPDDSREVLHAAAVASAWGGEAAHGLLAALSGLDDTALEAALRPAVDRGLLPTGERGYAFRHALLRRAIYEDVLPGARARLHARSGAALHDDPGLVPDGRAAAEEAAHWCRAGERERAFEALWRAALAARSVHAHPERLRILTRLLRQWDGIGEPERMLGTDRVDVLHNAAEACLPAGEAARGAELATEALALGPVPERAAALLELRSMLRHRLGDDGIADLRAGIELLPDGAPARGRLLATLANRLLLLGHTAEAAEKAAEARATGPDARVRASAMLTLGSIRGLDGDPDAARAAFAGAREAVPGGEAVLPVIAAMAETEALHGLGLDEQSAECGRRGLEVARRAGLARDQGAGLATKVAEPLFALGHWAEAAALLRDALALDPPPLFRALAHTRLGLIALAEGDVTGAADAAGEAHAIMSPSRWGRMFRLPLHDLRCQVALAQDDLPGADEILAGVLAEPGLAGIPRHAWPVLLTGARLAAERAARALGDPGEAQAAAVRLAGLRDLAGRLPVIGPVQSAQRKTFLAEAGDAPWDDAVSAWRELDRPHALAYALRHAAEASLDPVRCREAAGIASRLGAKPLLKEVELLAVRARLPLHEPEPRDTEPGDRLGLTPRETEVLRLVADGRSNRQIGETLFISTRTAGVHVSNILAKLDASSRTEAAALAHRLRLFGPVGQ